MNPINSLTQSHAPVNRSNNTNSQVNSRAPFGRQTSYEAGDVNQPDQSVSIDQRTVSASASASASNNISAQSQETINLLVKAISGRNPSYDRVVELLNDIEDVNQESENGRLPLFKGIISGKLNIVELLLEAGANVNQAQDGIFPLEGVFDSIYLKDKDEIYFKIAELLISKGANVNQKDKHGAFYLSEAILHGNFKMVKFLVENGADIKLVEQHCKNPIDDALADNNFEIAKVLIDNGADVNSIHNSNKNIIDFMRNGNLIDQFGLSMLINSISNHKISDDILSGIFETAKATLATIFKKAKFLIDNGNNLNHIDQDGKLPLAEAILAGDNLIENVIRNSNIIKERISVKAISDCYFGIAKLLIEKGADFNLINEKEKNMIFNVARKRILYYFSTGDTTTALILLKVLFKQPFDSDINNTLTILEGIPGVISGQSKKEKTKIPTIKLLLLMHISLKRTHSQLLTSQNAERENLLPRIDNLISSLHHILVYDSGLDERLLQRIVDHHLIGTPLPLSALAQKSILGALQENKEENMKALLEEYFNSGATNQVNNFIISEIPSLL